MSKKVFFLMVLGIFFAPALLSQIKIAYVNSEQIIIQLPEAQEAQKILEDMQKVTIDSLQLLERDFQTKVTDFQAQESMMTDDAKKKKQTELADLQARYNQYRQRKTDEIGKKRDELMRPIMEKIQKSIDQLAKDEGVNFIFDKTNSIPVVLYGDAQYNLTNKLLDMMIRGDKATKKKGK